MKKYLLLVFAVCLVATLALAADTTYTTKFYVQQGGDRAVVADGGSLDVESGGEIDVESGGSLKLAGTAVTSTATELNKLAGISGDVITTTNTKTMTNKTLTTPVISSIYTDATKDKLITLPATTDTLVGVGYAQTLTNKTLTTPIIASLYQDAGKTKLLTMPATSDTLATLNTAETLVNKTLTTPILASFYQDAGKTLLITVPATTDTLATQNDTETLTNKTLTSPVINTPSVVQSVAFHDYGASSADWTLSATEKKAVLLWVTNAGAASNIVAPAEARVYFVYNNSGQNVTIAAGGTGITVADARVAGVIYASGDYVRLTPDGAF